MSTSCLVVERPDHHCGDDLVSNESTHPSHRFLAFGYIVFVNAGIYETLEAEMMLTKIVSTINKVTTAMMIRGFGESCTIVHCITLQPVSVFSNASGRHARRPPDFPPQIEGGHFDHRLGSLKGFAGGWQAHSITRTWVPASSPLTNTGQTVSHNLQRSKGMAGFYKRQFSVSPTFDGGAYLLRPSPLYFRRP